MPRTSRTGQPRDGKLPGTLQRSSKEAQETFARAFERAVQTYGDGDQAYLEAFSVLKRTFEKRGDHWIDKDPGSSRPDASAMEQEPAQMGPVDS
jgi:ChaB